MTESTAPRDGASAQFAAEGTYTNQGRMPRRAADNQNIFARRDMRASRERPFMSANMAAWLSIAQITVRPVLEVRRGPLSKLLHEDCRP